MTHLIAVNSPANKCVDWMSLHNGCTSVQVGAVAGDFEDALAGA
jgi:hypothetical protein